MNDGLLSMISGINALTDKVNSHIKLPTAVDLISDKLRNNFDLDNQLWQYAIANKSIAGVTSLIDTPWKSIHREIFPWNAIQVAQDTMKGASIINQLSNGTHFGMKPLQVNYPWNDILEVVKLNSVEKFGFQALVDDFEIKTKDLYNLVGYNGDVTLADGLRHSIALDLEDATGDSVMEAEIAKYIGETTNIIDALLSDASSKYTLFNNFLRRIYHSKSVRSYTQTYLRDLSINLLVALTILSLSAPTQNIDNRTSIDKSVTNNTVVIENQCPIYIAIEKKAIRKRAVASYKPLLEIPIGSEMYVIKENQKWMLVSIIDADGSYVTGWTEKSGYDE